MKTYSTKRAAKLAKIHWVTLHRWLGAGKVRPSIAMRMNGGTLWRWTPADVARLREYKAAHYRKGRGRKARTEASRKPKR